VRVGASAVELKNPRQAHALGLGMVYQHFTLVENMTVVENLVMAREHVPAVIRWKDEVEKLRAFMKTMPFQVEPTSLVRNLAGGSGNGQRQLVEVLAGQRRAAGGGIRIHGERYRATRAEMRRHRFNVLPEMPLHNACVGTMTTAENLAFRSFDRPPVTIGGMF